MSFKCVARTRGELPAAQTSLNKKVPLAGALFEDVKRQALAAPVTLRRRRQIYNTLVIK